MKAHAQEILRRNFQFIVFIVMTVICAFTILSNFWLVSTLDEPIIIGIDANGTRLVESHEDPIFKVEAASFIRKFLFNLYNFDEVSFMRRIGTASNLMSEELWVSKKDSILDLRRRIAKDNIKVFGSIEKITVSEDGTYHGLVSLLERNRAAEKAHKIHVKLTVKNTKRSSNNPYGMEIDGYEEIRLNN